MTPGRLILATLYGVLPLALWPGSTSYEAAKFLVVFVAAGLLLLLSARGVLQRRPAVLPRRTDSTPYVLLLVVILFSGLFGAEMGRLWRTWTLTALWVVVFVAIAVACLRAGSVRWLLWPVVAGAVVSALYGLAQICGLLPGPDPALGVLPGISTFGNENQTAGYAAVALWVAVALVLLERGRLRALAGTAGGMLLLCVLAADATGPRLAVAAAAVVVIPAGLLLTGHRRRGAGLWLAGSTATGAVAAIVVIGVLLAPGPSRLPGVAADAVAGNSGHVRLTNWRVALHLVAAQGAGATGAGNYQVRWPQARAALGSGPDSASLSGHVPVATWAHNEYLQGLAELGPLGAVWFLGLAGATVMAWRRRLPHVPTDGRGRALLALWGGVLTTAVLALVSFPFHLPAPAMLLAGLLGVVTSGALETAPQPQPPRALPRGLAVPLAVVGLAVLVLGVREFTGDLFAARGERLYRAGRFAEALTDLDRSRAWAVWPGTTDLYRGLTLAGLGRDEDAALAYATSLAYAPRFEGYLGLAESEIQLGRFDTARAMLEMVTACGPTEEFRRQARYLSGLAHLRQGDRATARPVFEALLRDDPRHVRTLLALGYLNLMAGDEGDARRLYGTALRVVEEDLRWAETPEKEVRLRHLRTVARKSLESIM